MSATPLDQPLAEQLRGLLAQNDSTSVPSGVLLWFGDAHLPDGGAPRPTALTSPAWTAMYLRLLGAARPGVLPPPAAVAGRAAEPGEPIPLQIAAVDFHRFTDVAAAEIRRAASAGTTAELPTDLAASLEPAVAFAATVVLADQFVRDVPVVRGRSGELVLEHDGLIANGAPITDVTVDTGDGAGPRPIAPGEAIAFEVPADAISLDLTIAASVGDVRRTAACTVGVVDDPPPVQPDEIVPLCDGDERTGRLLCFRATSPGAPAADRWRAPVLVAEGFPGNHSAAYLADMLAQHGLLERLRSTGHDVAVIGFDQGSDTMQPNAAVVRAAIEYVLARTDDELVVSGWSMGGLITRFALAQMEQMGVDHRTAIYLSVDTPHGRGAYTTVAGQWCCEQLAGLSPALAGAGAVLAAPADQQFLAMYVDGDTVGPSASRRQFLADLEDVGWYPQRPRRYAVACGSGDGAQRVPVPIEPMMTWETDGFGDVVLQHLVDDGTVTIGEGASMGALDAVPRPVTTHSAVCWEIMPGSRERYFDLVVEPVRSLGVGRVTASLELGCAMPTVSALDLAIDPRSPIPAPGAVVCPFHDYTTSESDQRHLQLTPAVVDWIIDHIDHRDHQPATPTGEYRP